MVLKAMANDEITDGDCEVVYQQFQHVEKFPGAILIQ